MPTPFIPNINEIWRNQLSVKLKNALHGPKGIILRYKVSSKGVEVNRTNIEVT